eukprot:6300311-Pyramimonas_sp.AAC.1
MPVAPTVSRVKLSTTLPSLTLGSLAIPVAQEHPASAVPGARAGALHAPSTAVALKPECTTQH